MELMYIIATKSCRRIANNQYLAVSNGGGGGAANTGKTEGLCPLLLLNTELSVDPSTDFGHVDPISADVVRGEARLNYSFDWFIFYEFSHIHTPYYRCVEVDKQ